MKTMLISIDVDYWSDIATNHPNERVRSIASCRLDKILNKNLYKKKIAYLKKQRKYHINQNKKYNKLINFYELQELS